MVENRPFLTFFSHVVVILGVIVIAFPVWMTFVASTHDQATMLRSPVPLLPGRHLFENLPLLPEDQRVGEEQPEAVSMFTHSSVERGGHSMT